MGLKALQKQHRKVHSLDGSLLLKKFRFYAFLKIKYYSAIIRGVSFLIPKIIERLFMNHS